MFKSEELKGRSVKKFVSDELKIVNENVSLNWGLRAYRPDANVIGVGTLQISDDSLEKKWVMTNQKMTRQTKQEKTLVSFITLWFKCSFQTDMYGKF